MARGLVSSRKSDECGRSLTKRALGRWTLRTTSMPASPTPRCAIIQCGRYARPSSAENSSTPQCVDPPETGEVSRNIMGYWTCIWAADGRTRRGRQSGGKGGEAGLL